MVRDSAPHNACNAYEHHGFSMNIYSTNYASVCQVFVQQTNVLVLVKVYTALDAKATQRIQKAKTAFNYKINLKYLAYLKNLNASFDL